MAESRRRQALNGSVGELNARVHHCKRRSETQFSAAVLWRYIAMGFGSVASSECLLFQPAVLHLV